MMMLAAPVLGGALLSSCTSTREGVVVRDDVYYTPGDAPVAATAPPPSEATPEASVPADDYYSPEVAAETRSGSSGYYDMTYNDPYYYNYDRFGFNPTWNMYAGWGMGTWGGMNGWSIGMSTGWGRPGWGSPWGWNRPWGMSPWGWDPWGSPWGWNSPWNAGWGMGYGPYYGPWGACMTCYCPMVIGAGSGAYYGPRPGLGGSGVRPVKSAAGLTPRDPAGLARPVTTRPSQVTTRERDQRSAAPGTLSRPGTTRPSTTRGSSSSERPVRDPSVRPGGVERGTTPGRFGGFDRGGGSRPSAPSPGGGGVRPSTVPGRPR